ncbi:ABC transporter substrate-binding protein [Ideonella sp. A 288]|uniref:ABC transporter substrate-binding protein n=1 Tax=Ideonella sp. A 288 TaxID=1962181 RepID=UPI000B4C165F|nr:ABC transporter substrate-binding protein [Ideonella sp. A 288]
MSIDPTDATSLAMTRRLLLAAAAGAATNGVGGLVQAAPSPRADLSSVTLRVGTYKGNWRALMTAARALDTPYRLEWRELNNGTQHIEAIQAGALDLGFGSEVPAVFAARQKADVRFIAVVREDLNNLVTVARRDAPVRRIADLKGRRVAFSRGTIAHAFLSRQLTAAGLTMADISPVHLSPVDALSAFDRGDVDGWAIWGYSGQLARTTHGGRVIQTAVGHASGNFPIYAHPSSIGQPEKAAAIADFLLRLRGAYRWANGHFLEFARAQNAETRVPVGDLVELWNNRSTDYDLLPADARAVLEHQRMADLFLKEGVLDAPTQVAGFWDHRFDATLR